MGNSTRPDGDISRLHPIVRSKVQTIQKQLKAEKIPFEVFEAFRTPERQAKLYAQRPKVTWVGPWGSIHQYGLAVDFVLRLNGGWSWKDTGAEAKYWTRMHEVAKENGMTPLYNKAGKLIEKPHIQLVGVSAAELRKGHYPEGGDVVWAEHLAELIDNWEGPEPAPPKPSMAPTPPPIDATLLAELEELAAAEAPAAASAPSSAPAHPPLAAQDARFQKLNAFITRWEGGYVDHPSDKGGATNMGITIGTLADWRGTEVTKEDVKKLTRSEADEIFRARYYAVCRCGEMPERMAMVVYNCAVLSGPKRAIQFVQRAFNALGLTANGEALEVDGILGPVTMGAIRQVDPSSLANAFMDVQEDYLRGLDTFHVFGAGWLNRMAALREFVETLPQGAGLRPKSRMKIGDGKLDLDFDKVLDRLEGDDTSALSGLVDTLLAPDSGDSASSKRNKALLKLLLDARRGHANGGATGVGGGTTADAGTPPVANADPVTMTTGADGKTPLTPINAALGEPIGRVLNGKKSVSGIIGLLLTTLLPRLGISGDIVTFLVANSDALVTFFSLLTGWGMFGKVDKAIRLMGLVSKKL